MDLIAKLNFIVFIMINGCDNSWVKHIPNELLPSKVTYLVDETHLFGPSGINRAFVVYEFDDEKKLRQIKIEGLPFLKKMASTTNYKRLEYQYKKYLENAKPNFDQKNRARKNHLREVVGLYKNWKETPIKNVQMWNKDRGGYTNESIKYTKGCMGISICSFYGDYTSRPPFWTGVLENRTLNENNMSNKIKNNYRDLVEEIIKSPGSYFGYGEYGAFIVAPKYKKMFLLFRH